MIRLQHALFIIYTTGERPPRDTAATTAAAGAGTGAAQGGAAAGATSHPTAKEFEALAVKPPPQPAAVAAAAMPLAGAPTAATEAATAS